MHGRGRCLNEKGMWAVVGFWILVVPAAVERYEINDECNRRQHHLWIAHDDLVKIFTECCKCWANFVKMGCASSKVDNEEIVSRCRERKRLMRQAVNSRHNFAAAHSAYLRALRNTGAALKQFAEGESMVMAAAVAEETPPSLLPEYRPRHMKFTAQPPPPPPPPFEMSPNPSIQSSGFSSRRIPHILSSSENSRAGSPPPPPPPPPPPGVARDRTGDDYWAPSQYSGTPSYQGSMWNGWEPFGTPPPPSPRIQTDEHGSVRGGFYRRSEDRSADGELDDSSTDAEDENDQTREPDSEPEVENSIRESAKSPAREADDISSMVSRYTKDTDMQMIISRKCKDLGEIVRDLDEYFLRAASAGKEVSRILETSRTQFEFGQPTKKVYHSSNMFNVLSWTWSSKPPLAIRYTLEPADAGAYSSHCSTLERLLAWEKKLYAEVRSGEATKIEQEKKLALLQNQEVKGENEIKVDKTRASIKRLQSLIMVAGQAVNTTSVAILKLRENELCPQLVELSEGLMQMWRAMNGCHKIQTQIVEQVKHLETLAGREATSDHHHHATRQLEVEVTEWYNSFCSLIKSQREYMRALFGWLRLSLIQLDNETTRGLGKPPPIYSLCDEWQQALERLPDKAASEAIKSFIAVVHAIVVQQAEEQKHKKKSESLSKELQRKMISLRDIENKYYSSYSLPDRSRGASDSGYEFDPRDPLAGKRAEIDVYKRRVEDEKSNHLKSVQATRAMTLNNIRTGLPGVFQAMASFSSVCMHAFETVYNQTKSFGDHSSVRMLE